MAPGVAWRVRTLSAANSVLETSRPVLLSFSGATCGRQLARIAGRPSPSAPFRGGRAGVRKVSRGRARGTFQDAVQTNEQYRLRNRNG
jgi:hypothetical protein